MKKPIIIGLITFGVLGALSLGGASVSTFVFGEDENGEKITIESLKEEFKEGYEEGMNELDDDSDVEIADQFDKDLNDDNLLSSGNDVSLEDKVKKSYEENDDLIYAITSFEDSSLSHEEKFEIFYDTYEMFLEDYEYSIYDYLDEQELLNEDGKYKMGSFLKGYDDSLTDASTKQKHKEAYDAVIKELEDDLMRYVYGNHQLLLYYEPYFLEYMETLPAEDVEKKEMYFDTLIMASEYFVGYTSELIEVSYKSSEIHFDKFDETSQSEREDYNQQGNDALEGMGFNYTTLVDAKRSLQNYLP